MESAVHSTYVIGKTYTAEPERVFAAFADPEKKRRWFAEREGVTEHRLDFRVGGQEYTRMRTPIDGPLKGASFTNETIYQDIVPERRIVFAYTVAVEERRISASLVTVEFVGTERGGTELIFTEQAAFFEGADGPKMREHGWQQTLGWLDKVL